ncbi:alkaline phosphatase family protein [Methanocella arvoryzae]|uniref:Predicted phosphoglycerate mutase n=1 Tax=Methanocella arvoryzae (strain DSM 22066 / NBRC 105507 / MRE50) TaxID=351160 RepID=Q0W1M1_METAR|nr:alkaline phosphatase family protein [Methanocella arvoryzae]CAJ37722.1 predicted phosphoglycerate mutase [Methanocella arvoryzae MRE50]
MRLLHILLAILLLSTLPCTGTAEKSAVLVIVDGMGASYIYPELSPDCADGTPLDQVKLDILDAASARYTLEAPVPKTEYGHAVLVTGYSEAEDETLTYYEATIFDSLRKQGYLCIAVLETGDTAYMLGEMDAVVRDANNSVSRPDFQYWVNDERVPAGVRAILADNSLPGKAAGKDKIAAYKRYDNWSLGKAIELVKYMEESHPEQPYLLTINVAGTDYAGHENGFDAYSATLAGLDPLLRELTNVCRDSGTIMLITADHGMSFKSASSRGAHASAEAAGRNESLLIPLLIFTDEPALGSDEIYGQECVAPTLLSLMGCQQGMTMCDGEALPWNDRPALQLESMVPVNVTIAGPGFGKTVLVNGTLRMGGLEKGVYRIEAAGHVYEVLLTHDTVVRLAASSPGQSELPAFAIFLAAGGLAAAGIIAVMLRQR